MNPSTDVAPDLIRENVAYARTGGVSSGNRTLGFTPGFLDTETGAVFPSRDPNGQLATIHRLDGLPDCVVEARNAMGRVARVKRSLVSGFLRAGRFYTRSEAVAIVDAAGRDLAQAA